MLGYVVAMVICKLDLNNSGNVLAKVIFKKDEKKMLPRKKKSFKRKKKNVLKKKLEKREGKKKIEKKKALKKNLEKETTRMLKSSQCSI